MLLRRNGADPATHASSKGIAALVELNATDAQILTALETAKKRRRETESAQPVNAAYLVQLVSNLQRPQDEKPNKKPRDEWWKTDLGIDRKAQELGMVDGSSCQYAHPTSDSPITRT